MTESLNLIPPGKIHAFTIFILILLILIRPVWSFGQDLNRKITIRAKNTSLAGVLDEIGKKGGIYFSYNPAILPQGKKISVKAIDKPAGEVLTEVLEKNGLEYSIVENQVVIRKQSGVTGGVITNDRPEKQKHMITGYVRERSTGEVLIGANIIIKGTSLGTMTNGYGFYSITIPAGSYRIVISYMGFKSFDEQIILDRNISLSAELDEAKTEMKEVEISANGSISNTQNNKLSELSFSHATLAQLPGFGGNLDIIRALQVIPGIQTFGDGSSLYYVRGGNNDQNLMMIDEVPVYNPSHLFGFFSAFSPDVINDVRIYKGDFPAKYGGKLSSVIDIKVKDGNMKEFGFSGNVGPYASTLTLEGPIIRDKMSFLVSGRMSTLFWLAGMTKELTNLDFLFYDIHSKLNYRINGHNRIYATFYTGKDIFSQVTNSSYRTYGISWDNMAGTLRWNHIFNNGLFSNTTLNYSRYNHYLYISENRDDYWKSTISNITAKTDFTWFMNPNNTLKAGFEVTSHFSNPGNVTLVDGSDMQAPAEVSDYHSMEYDLYVSNDQSIGKHFALSYGIRLYLWQDWGPASVYYFNVNHQVSDTVSYIGGSVYSSFLRPDPRISIQYKFNDGSFLKTSYCRTSQFMQSLSNSTSPFTTLAVWIPAGPNIKPQSSDQFALGYFRKVLKSKLNFSAEIYYKYNSGNVDYEDHANLLYNPLLEGEVRQGIAWSYGFELMLRKSEGHFTGWIGYSWSRAFINTTGVNSDNSFPASWDRPNDICINLSYTDKKHWTATANWIYLSGNPFTTPTGFYYDNGYSVPLYGSRNNDRLPAYHRLDLSASYCFSKPANRYQHSLTVTLYNVYGRFNPFSVSFNKVLDDNGDFVVPAGIDGNYQLIPTTISVAGMIPSVNYQFRF